LNILIIGVGSIARKHIAAIREVIPDASIYALRSSKTAEQIEGVHSLFSLDDIKIILDFIIISNPTQLHEQSIRNCIQFDCPLFIEKPVLSSTAHADSLAKQIKEKNIITYVACNLRFHPTIQFLKKHLEENQQRINEANIYCGSFLPDWRPGKNFKEIYSANASMGGGVHLDLIHEIDYCLWLFGKPLDIRSLKRNASSLQIDAVDFAFYHLLYPSFSANVSLNYFRKDSKREIEIVFEDHTLKADLLTSKVSIGDKIIFEQPYHIQETYTKQLTYFIDHIVQQKKPMNSFTEAIDVLKIVLS
jgi:predicted dehydrogenase